MFWLCLCRTLCDTECASPLACHAAVATGSQLPQQMISWPPCAILAIDGLHRLVLLLLSQTGVMRSWHVHDPSACHSDDHYSDGVKRYVTVQLLSCSTCQSDRPSGCHPMYIYMCILWEPLPAVVPAGSAGGVASACSGPLPPSNQIRLIMQCDMSFIFLKQPLLAATYIVRCAYYVICSQGGLAAAV